mmetsp:Transcript_3929/g.6710  ORF Transcript_3929/g.6710 Transcript_3929/m.6710 type:complete len:307 (-) Transcript_3929:520-1440(-)
MARNVSGMTDRSMFGAQVVSTKPNFPAYGFGTSGRTSSTKLFFTKEQTKRNLGLVSPGPVYDVSSSLGGQISSKCTTFPAFKFGARSLLDSNLAKEARPGPGTYPLQGSIGNQTESQRGTSTSWKFGTSGRWGNSKHGLSDGANAALVDPKPASGWLGDAAAFSFGSSNRYVIGEGIPGCKPTFKSVPGPGAYQLHSCLGPQPLSNKCSATNVKFGTQTRERSEKVYLTHAHERSMYGRHSPAPNAYTLKSSLGQQTTSKNRSSSSFKFGTGDRFTEVKRTLDTTGRDSLVKGVPAMTPGPGSYCI